jgi:hypothetical protein
LSVVTLPSKDGDEADRHGLVTNLLEEGEMLVLDLFVTALGVLDGLVVHLVHGDNHLLLDTKGVSKKGVLTGLSVLGDSRLETKNGNISLRGSGDHVLDEITMSGGVNNGERELGGLELP